MRSQFLWEDKKKGNNDVYFILLYSDSVLNFTLTVHFKEIIKH